MANPLVIAGASEILQSKEGQQTLKQGLNAVKVITVGLGAYFVGKIALDKLNRYRAKQYANENIGHPDLIASSIIYKSFTRIGYKEDDLLSFILPEIDIFTNESALYDIARKVTDAKSVAKSYKILFQRNLNEDINKGLDTKELKKFWSLINSPNKNVSTLLYPTGTILYSAVKGKQITVNKAEKDSSGKWKGTNKLYGNFELGEEIGNVIANGIFTDKEGKKENYYVVKESRSSNIFKSKDNDRLNRSVGVVLQHQVTNNEN